MLPDDVEIVTARSPFASKLFCATISMTVPVREDTMNTVRVVVSYTKSPTSPPIVASESAVL
jgi:hypothetical protein